MVERMVEVGINFEARPAALFVQAASKFKSHIELKTGTKTINAKSIMGMFALSSIVNGCIAIIADGEDEQQAIEELSVLLTNAS